MDIRVCAVVLLAFVTACGSGTPGPQQPKAECNLVYPSCPGTSYLAVAQAGGIALFTSPFSGRARASIPLDNATGFAERFYVDTPPTWFVGVPPNQLYSYDYPYGTSDGTYSLPVSDISHMAFIAVPAFPAGTLLIADAVNNDLAFVDLWANPPTVMQTVGGLDHPNAFDVDAQQRLWVAESSDIAILTIGPDGTISRTGSISSGLSAPGGILKYDDGSMYVADSGNNTIEVFAPNETTPVFSISNGLNKPRSLMEGYNLLFVANTGDNSIAAYALPLTPSSTPVWINRNLSGTPRDLAPWFSPSF